MKKEKPVFRNHMSKGERIAGLIYLPIHIFLLPVFIAIYSVVSPAGLTDASANLIYYAIGFLFTLFVMKGMLRRGYDEMADKPGNFLVTLLWSYLLYIVIANLCVAAIFYLVGEGQNPNNEAVADVVGESFGMMFAASVFMAPMVEELLFRGAVFGGLMKKNRILAYVVSILAFGIYHLWQYIAFTGDWTMLVYILNYVPGGVVLAWSYERTSSIWAPIFIHMFINAVSMYSI